MSELPLLRDQLHVILDYGETWVIDNWPRVKPRIETWWKVYKRWESTDTFDEAFLDNRMTVRTFDQDFDKQVSKTFGKGTISFPDNRFFADSQYTRLGSTDQQRHGNAYATGAKQDFHAKRGIDSSAFANPANFASRITKYEAGLHDLSASLLNHKFPIPDQVHNQGQGVHYSFLPLSWPEDQEVLYRLILLAKKLRTTLPMLYDMVRGYRAAMTRVKLAQDSDMGVGYTAVPVAEPGDGPAYKLRYGLGNKTTLTGNPVATLVTPERYAARQRAARNFREILLTEYAAKGHKNEIVIAIRQHAGRFPVHAFLKGFDLVCYEIDDNKMKETGHKISLNGKMT